MTLVFVFLVLFLLLGFLLFLLCLSLFFVCFLLSVMSSLLSGTGHLLNLGMVGLLRSLSSLFDGIILSFDSFSSHSLRAATLTIRITDGLGSGGLLITFALTTLFLLVFVRQCICLPLQHLILDTSLDVLVVFPAILVGGLCNLIVLALLELGFDRGDGICVGFCRGSGLCFGVCLSCFSLLDSLIGRNNIISTLLTICLTSGFLFFVRARIF